MIKKARSSQKGIAMLTATVIIILVAGMSAAFLMLSFNQRKFSSEASESELTLHLAEAGVDDTLNKMQAYALAWAANKTTPSIPTSWDFAFVGGTPTQVTPPPPAPPYYIVTNSGAINGGTWTVTVQNNKGTEVLNSLGTQTIFPNPFSYDYPTFVNPIWFILTATATRGKNVRTIQVLTSAFDTSSTFKYGLFGNVQVDALGTFSSDGFNSSNGTYASQATNHHTFPNGKTATYADATGNLGSNGNIIANGNTQIMGNATPGPGGTTSGGGQISGSTTPATALQPLPAPSVTVPTGVTPIQTAWTSGTLPLGTSGSTSPTVYHMSNMQPTGPGTLKILGDVDLYIDGPISMSNQQAIDIMTQGLNGPNATLRIYQTSGDITINGQAFAGQGAAKNFQLYSTTTGTIKFNGGSTVFAAVDAPAATFTNNGGNEFFGSLVAAQMKLSGTAYFHYDEALAQLSNPVPKFKIVSWRETAH